ncbi:hypothetical protein JW960_14840 [candidate division KSB1 bacterium]|nr:hypothetical protein [candidate division KSB1 bacterium]
MIRHQSTYIWVLCLCCSLFQPAHAQVKKVWGPFRPFEKTSILKINPVNQTYMLSDSFIVRDSERFTVGDSLLVRGTDYEINYINGIITLLHPARMSADLKCIYHVLPIGLRRQYYHHQMKTSADSAVRIVMFPPEKSRRDQNFGRSRLRKNGSIIRGVSLGSNQGLKVESGLRMNISGNITDNVEVVAALTDQTTPIQPEGNTQTLNEIDKVYVQVKSNRFNATMGDYYLTFEGSEFGQYNRKLKGAMGTADFKDHSVTISGAVSRGKYTSNQFNGLEGNQGPYQLKGERGQIDIIVLAGSEKVWIDGEIMTRGENNDYVIEYSTGEITFTRHRLITSDSRITVDFQYSDLKYQRALYGAHATSAFVNDRIKLDIRMIREADNRDNPLDFNLTDENRKRLEAAGDNSDSSFVSGIRYVGEGKGTYQKVDSLVTIFYRYVGRELGEYQISFTYVGAEKGTYKSIGFGNYKYVGDGNGNYLPEVYLTPAQEHDLADIGLKLNVTNGIALSQELAVSRFDQNSFSNKDDGNNAGSAYVTAFNMSPTRLTWNGTSFGEIKIASRYRQVRSQFRQIDRTGEVEKSRKWDSGDVTDPQESIWEFDMEYKPITTLAVGGGFGTIDKGNTFSSNRRDARLNLKATKLPQIQYQIEQITSDNSLSNRTGDWTRQSGELSQQLKRIKPYVTYSSEQKHETFQDTSNVGFRYNELTTGLDMTPVQKMRTHVALSLRDDENYEQLGFQALSQAITQKYEWSYTGGNRFTATTSYIHREKRFEQNQGDNKRTDLGEITMNVTPVDKVLTTNWQYQISNTQVAQKERVYLKVAEGEGEYRFNEATQEYEPYDLGDYVLRIRQTDDFTPVVDLRTGVRIRFTPGSRFGKNSSGTWGKMLTSLSSDTYIRIEEKTEERDVWSIYRLDLAKFQHPGTTIYGQQSLRHDMYLFQNRSDMSVRLRIDTRKQVNYEYLEGGQETEFNEQSVRFSRQISGKLGMQVDALRSFRSYLYTARTDKIISGNEFDVELSFRPKQALELGLRTHAAIKKDTAPSPATKALEWTINPLTSYSFSGKGRLQAELNWTKITAEPTNRIIPFELTGMNRLGTNWRWQVQFNYNVSKNMRASISYSGRIEPDRPGTIHIARAEMRAFF